MNLEQEFETEKQSFNLYYQEKIRPVLEPLEKRRKHYFVIFIFLCFFILLWFVNIFLGLIGFEEGNIVDIGILPCFAVLGLCWPLFSYYKRHKEILLPLIADFFGDFSYEYQPNIQKDVLEKSLILKLSDKFQIDDAFIGKYKDVDVNILEYNTFKKRILTNRTEDYQKDKHGILFWAAMNKHFTGQTIVVKDKGIFNKMNIYKGMKPVKIESTIFEKKFEVYSTDQIEARYILTTVMVECMLKLKKDFSKIEYSFFENHILINIETKKNMFECNSFFTSMLNRQQIDKIFTEFYLIFSIVNTLRLNENKLL
jgi:hypothetical protein